jgi:transcriptional regulator with XRE-family HTH domain
MCHGIEGDEENGHEREQEGSNSEDGHVLESEQEEQSRAVVARTNEVRRNVKKALKSLQMTQKALSSKLGISQAKISQWLNKHAVAEPETILIQMISFLEAEGASIKTKINAGSSAKRSTGSNEGSNSNSSKYETQLATVQLHNEGTTTPPPPTVTATPNAPPADTSRPSLNNEPNTQGGYAHGRGGKNIDQVDMNQDMNAMPDNGLM